MSGSELGELMVLLRHPARRLMWRRLLSVDEPRSAKDFSLELRVGMNRLAWHLVELKKGGAIEIVDPGSRKGGSTKKLYAPTEKFDRRRVLAMIDELDGESE